MTQVVTTELPVYLYNNPAT